MKSKIKRELDVSVIVPFYNGNEYITGLIEMIKKNVMEFGSNPIKVELIIVNDSPLINVAFNNNNLEFEIRCITNKKNYGIHKSRCIGIRNARGRYIALLDQDDLWSDTWLLEQWKSVQSADLVISNVIYSKRHVHNVLYANKEYMRKACNKWELCIRGNKIISPGQVLMKKELIPLSWMKYTLAHNGADDYFLWILIFEKKVKIKYNLHTLYFHQYNEKSVSSKSRVMRKSEQEMVQVICNYKLVNWMRREIYRFRYL